MAGKAIYVFVARVMRCFRRVGPEGLPMALRLPGPPQSRIELIFGFARTWTSRVIVGGAVYNLLASGRLPIKYEFFVPDADFGLLGDVIIEVIDWIDVELDHLPGFWELIGLDDKGRPLDECFAIRVQAVPVWEIDP